MLFHIKLFRAKQLLQIINLADDYIFHGDLEKIIEVTYSYRETSDGFFMNETLFEEYLWPSYVWKDISSLWRAYKYKIGVQLVLIDDIIKKTKKLKMEARSEKLRRDIFIEALEYIKIILEISTEGVEFEMEKAGYFQKITKKKVKSKIKKIEKLEKEVFGCKVMDDREEFSRWYNFVLNNYNKNKNKLSEKENIAMKRYLKIMKQSVKHEMLKAPITKNKAIRWSFLKQEICRKDYRIVFDTVCEFYNLPQRTKLTSAWSIYDGDKFLEIPRDAKYANFTIDRLLKLLTHEIESHYINSHNGKILLWNFRGAKNLPKEEWLAIFMEKIFVGHNYDDIGHTVGSLLRILSWELLEWKDYEDFLRIMNVLTPANRDYSNAVIRSKRNYSFSHKWVQHKDVVYFRGLTDTINYLKSWWEFRKLFLGKVWFHDLEHLSDIYDRYEEKSEIVFPIFISDLVYYYLWEIKKDAIFVFNSQRYYLYLKRKYWFLDLDAFKIIEQIDTKWKKIEKIINIFEKAVK